MGREGVWGAAMPRNPARAKRKVPVARMNAKQFLNHLEANFEFLKGVGREYLDGVKKAPPAQRRFYVGMVSTIMADLIVLNSLMMTYLFLLEDRHGWRHEFDEEKKILNGSMAQLMIEVRRLKYPRREGDSDSSMFR